MISLSDLKKELEPRIQILIRAKQYYWDIQYLGKPDRAEELIFIEQEPFLQKVYYSFATMVAIELSKLFGPTSGYNLQNLLTKLSSNSSSEWSEKLNNAKIDSWKSVFDSEEIKIALRELERLKQMMLSIAGNDQIKKLSVLLGPFEGIQVLIKLAEDILVGINTLVFQNPQSLRFPFIGRANHLVSSLLELRDRKYEVNEPNAEG